MEMYIWCSHCRERCGESSKKFRKVLPYDPAVSLLDLYPNKIIILKSYLHSHVHSSIIFNSPDRDTV